MTSKAGQFVAVSTGMLLAGHISVRARSYLEHADVIFCLVPHSLIETWLIQINANVISLQGLYAEGKHRMDTYEEMVAMMMGEVRAGKNVCGAFYGHAGVFAWAPHETVRQARSEGYLAHMEPGISAEACLYADLSIDPGTRGLQHFEATQFLLYDHIPNNRGYLVLWQIGLVGEHTATSLSTNESWVKIFIEHMLQWYSAEHSVIIYEAAILPVEGVRQDTIPLKDLYKQKLKLHSTLVVPPAEELKPNQRVLELLAIEEQDIAKRVVNS
ncbi:SAM-dependent methyltransferase [Kangiella sp.]|uniref:SAM-dependent methyltransferase n=1 Tax=Kangiella sp. TaxID=1920245 RepID=UPI003A92E3FD